MKKKILLFLGSLPVFAVSVMAQGLDFLNSQSVIFEVGDYAFKMSDIVFVLLIFIIYLVGKTRRK